MKLLFFNSRSNKTKIFFLIILSLILFVLFDRAAYIIFKNISFGFYNKTRQTSVNLNLKKEEIEFYDTLIMGSSRTRRAIHPLYLKKYLGLKALKISEPGRYLRYNYTYYTIYRKKYKVPKYLFYGIDYFIFKKYSNQGKMINILSYFEKQPEIDMKLNFKLFNPISNPSMLFKEKENIDIFINDFIDHLSKLHVKDKKGPLISEYIGKKRSIKKKLLIEPRHWRKSEFARYPGLEGKFLDLLLDKLEKDKVKVFLVIIPDFIGVYRTNFEQKLFSEEIISISKKYSNIMILDYNSPEKFGLSNTRLFKDGNYGNGVSHLSYYGAEILNKMICDDIKEVIEKDKSLL